MPSPTFKPTTFQTDQTVWRFQTGVVQPVMSDADAYAGMPTDSPGLVAAEFVAPREHDFEAGRLFRLGLQKSFDHFTVPPAERDRLVWPLASSKSPFHHDAPAVEFLASSLMDRGFKHSQSLMMTLGLLAYRSPNVSLSDLVREVVNISSFGSCTEVPGTGKSAFFGWTAGEFVDLLSAVATFSPSSKLSEALGVSVVKFATTKIQFHPITGSFIAGLVSRVGNDQPNIHIVYKFLPEIVKAFDDSLSLGGFNIVEFAKGLASTTTEKSTLAQGLDTDFLAMFLRGMGNEFMTDRGTLAKRNPFDVGRNYGYILSNYPPAEQYMAMIHYESMTRKGFSEDQILSYLHGMIMMTVSARHDYYVGLIQRLKGKLR